MSILERFKQFPKAAPYIVVTEWAERFSFYGMKAILSTFLISQFFNPGNNPALTATAEAHSNEVTHLFVALVYLLSIVAYWPIMYWAVTALFYISLLSIVSVTLFWPCSILTISFFMPAFCLLP